jgi:hypothetical protein
MHEYAASFGCSLDLDTTQSQHSSSQRASFWTLVSTIPTTRHTDGTLLVLLTTVAAVSEYGSSIYALEAAPAMIPKLWLAPSVVASTLLPTPEVAQYACVFLSPMICA